MSYNGISSLQWYISHYNDVIMSVMESSLSIVYSTVCSGADQRKHHSSTSLAFVRGIHRWPVNSPHNGPVAWKMFPFDDVIMHHFAIQIHNSKLSNPREHAQHKSPVSLLYHQWRYHSLALNHQYKVNFRGILFFFKLFVASIELHYLDTKLFQCRLLCNWKIITQ